MSLIKYGGGSVMNKIYYIHNLKDYFKKKKCDKCRGWWEARELSLCERVNDLEWENKWLKSELELKNKEEI